MNVTPSATYEAVLDSGQTGLVGTLELGVYDGQGAVTEALSAAGIIETPAGSGVYVATRTAPATAGQYVLLWSLDGTTDPEQVITDDLTVSAAGVAPGTSVLCQAWITAEDVAANCTSAGTDASILDEAAQTASDILYVASGRKYPGECGPVTVRPCNCTVCPPTSCCSCCGLSQVRLLGWVREVTAVKIDGDTVPPGEYRVDSHRWLSRLPVSGSRVRQVWPGCQRLDLEDTETDTFSVAYTYGQDPPQAGILAALELACQIAAAAEGGECALPPGAVKVTRQGIEVDLQQVASALLSLPLVGMFLSVYNPSGQKRKTGLWSPDLPAAPRVLG